MGTTADKLKYLNDTKIEIKNALETTSTVMREYPDLIKKYIDNQPTKIVSDGICSNAVDLPVKAVGIDGNSYQETTEGINKFNLGYVSQSSSKVLTDTGVNLKNCYGTETFTFENTAKTFKPNTTYTMKVKAKVVSRPSTIGAANKAIFSLYRAPSSSLGADARDLVIMTDKDTVALNTEKEYIHTFTTMSDMTNVRLLSYTFYGNNDGSTTYVPSGEIDVSDIMMVEGSYTLDNFPDYEPYTGGIPSPNPDYPQEITNVGENGIKIKQSGKNSLNVPANFTVTNTNIHNDIAVSLKANITYTIKAKTISSDNKDVTNCLFRFRYNNADVSNPYARIPISSLKTTYTPPADIDEVWIYSGTSHNESASSNTTFEDLMIYEGTEDASYEPYHEPIITPINLQGNILSKIGDVKDILRVNRNGEVEIKKNTGKIVLDGSEKLIDNKSTSIRTYWGIDFRNYGIYQYNDPTKVCDVLTTKFKSRPQQGTFLPGQVALITSNKNMYFVFEPDTTEEQARAILKDMPVYFRLAEPQIITLPSITPIELWQGTNIFKLITNLDTDSEVEYIVDKDSVLNEVQTAMLEAEI